MNRLRIAFLLLITLSSISMVRGQEQSLFRLDWEILTQAYAGSGPVLNRLTIKNQSDHTLGVTDWAIFFNGGGVQVPEEGPELVKVQWINGDYYKIIPGKDWQPIGPGEQTEIELRLNNLLNVRNIPKGLYIVHHDSTEGMAVQINLLPNPILDSLEVKLAQEIYDKNLRISTGNHQQPPPLVIPTPANYRQNEDNFILNAQIPIIYEPSFSKEAHYLQNDLGDFLLQIPSLKPANTSQNLNSVRAINLRFQAGMGEEAYHVLVNRHEIQLIASQSKGMFYAIQSLKALFPINAWKEKKEVLEIPGVEIQDTPRFKHRAFMMDVARNFQSQKQVFKVLDLLAFYKINVLHFHLTDDEGWRLQIPGLPELTEVGGRRGHTPDEEDHLIPSYGSGPTTDNPFGSGFYTRQEFIEILQYAQDRHIRVIPEIETPGHARAAVKAMESRFHRLMKEDNSQAAWKYRLTDPNDRSEYRSAQAWTDNVMNVAMPSVYTFLEKVFDEIISMYREADAPLATIHIGGDEVPNGVWEKSPLVQSFMSTISSHSLGGASTENADGLWYYYLSRVAQILKKKNLYLSGWEEVGMKKAEVQDRKTMVVDPSLASHQFHVDVWNNVGNQVDLAYRLANAGYPVVLTNVTNFYMDLAYNTSFYENGHQWGGHVDLDKTFRFAPFDYFKSLVDNRSGKVLEYSTFAGKARLTEDGKTKIIGIQAPLWSEFILGPERLEFMLLPKILGLAERAWAPERQWETLSDSSAYEQAYRQDWTQFVHQIGRRELPRLDDAFGGFLYRIPTPGLLLQNGKWHANAQIPDFTIRFTTDGSEPTPSSTLYVNPVPVITGERLVFRVFNQNGRGGRAIPAF